MTTTYSQAATTDAPPVVIDKPEEDAAYRKVTLRLMPFLLVAYIFAYIDRINVGFAKLHMLNDLSFSNAVYGLGAGLFFIGYFCFEVPSNVLMHRIGARRTISRIMVLWGLISAGMAFVETPTQFYVMRFFLGVAEAGFYPGILLYLTYWYPSARRAKAIALFMLAIPFSGVFGGPLSGWLLDAMDGVQNMKGWQWMFIVEAIPSVLCGVIAFFFLDDKVKAAKWLTPREKMIIEQNLQAEESQIQGHSGLGQVFKDVRVIRLAAICFCMLLGQYALTFWLPSLIKQAGVESALEIGMMTAVPFGAAAIAMVLLSKSSDKRGERRFHLSFGLLIGAAGLVCSALFSSNLPLALLSLTVASAGILAATPVFWTIPSAMLKGVSSAAGLALICAFGSLAGFVSPYMIGWVKDATQSTDAALFVLAAMLTLGALITLTIPKTPSHS
ncbi:MFS transporter [Pseudomonas taiwanensis]|uniref:MFS transporter n=1 Tax=Pseudomonas taiwanensis TaxID=470150 RepID=A0ABR6V397_9PSED|nr:MFS transporter [Pseudomonas taiwanensis]MBC3474977.1 MFS transporter [Pseudomonas taiwanensis]